MPFHLYYGWGALLLRVWAALMVALYRRTGSVLPISAAHAVWDAAPTIGDGELGGSVHALAALAGLGVIIVSFWAQVKRIGAAEKAEPAA